MPGGLEAEQIARYEELSLSLWPARTFVFCDGWIVGMSDGHTRRANCVVPLRSGRVPLPDRIRRCERLLESAGLQLCFKLTECSQPAGLDAALAGLGYEREAETLVETATLDGDSARQPGDIEITDQVTPPWLAAYRRLHALSDRDAAGLVGLLDRIHLPIGCALAADADGAAACGLCTLDGDVAGLFGIATAAAKRRRGLGRRVTSALLGWAERKRAGEAFLQVTLENEGARALYSSMGFVQLYRYWYRVKGVAPAAGPSAFSRDAP